jgi:hypothetical protein
MLSGNSNAVAHDVNDFGNITAEIVISHKLTEGGEVRTAYISALKCADQGDIQPLMKFAI